MPSEADLAKSPGLIATTDEFKLLTWLVDEAGEPPSAARVDEDLLLRLVGYHRLQNRLLARLRRERPDWPSETLIARLTALRAEAQSRLVGQLDAVAEIADALAAAGEGPLVIVKGFSTHALLKTPETVPFSHDIDLLCRDNEQGMAVLTGLGYDAERHPMYGFFEPHEYATLWRGDIYLELHRFLRCWRYPQGVLSPALEPDRFPGHWRQSFEDAAESRLQYEDLRQNAVPCDLFPQGRVLVPNAELAVTILCIHSFGNYMSAPTWQIRLGELADIVQLTRTPGFREDRCAALVTRHGAADAVRFVGALLHSLCGHNPLACCAAEGGAGFPFPVCFYGCWAVPAAPEELVLPLPYRDLLRRLGPNPVVAPTMQMSGLYGVDTGDAPMERVITQSRPGAALPFQFSVANAQGRLVFRVFLPPESDPQRHYSAAVYDISGTASAPVPGDGGGRGGDDLARLLQTGPAVPGTVSLSVVHPLAPAERRSVRPVLRLLVVSRSDADAHADVIAVVPLEIIRYASVFGQSMAGKRA